MEVVYFCVTKKFCIHEAPPYACMDNRTQKLVRVPKALRCDMRESDSLGVVALASYKVRILDTPQKNTFEIRSIYEKYIEMV